MLKKKDMINVQGDRNANYPGLIMTHCIYISDYHTVLSKHVELKIDNIF